MNKINLQDASKQILPGILNMGGSDLHGNKISFTNYYMEWNRKSWRPVMGEFHYSRFPFLFWEEELLKMKAGGVQVVATYAIWNHHEEESGIFDFSGSRNLRAFIDGQFVHDDFRNGTVWEIGLKRFLPRILEKGILLKLTPKVKSKVSFTEMAAIKVDNDSCDATVFQSIAVVPEYKCIMRKRS